MQTSRDNSVTTYTKSIFLSAQSPRAYIHRDGELIKEKSWILFNTSLKNQVRYMKKAHKWADNAIELCKLEITEKIEI